MGGGDAEVKGLVVGFPLRQGSLFERDIEAATGVVDEGVDVGVFLCDGRSGGGDGGVVRLKRTHGDKTYVVCAHVRTILTSLQ